MEFLPGHDGLKGTKITGSTSQDHLGILGLVRRGRCLRFLHFDGHPPLGARPRKADGSVRSMDAAVSDRARVREISARGWSPDWGFGGV
jgi:hypothetical protein